MLNRLNLTNFKSARNLSIPLKNLTILSGLNGSGKSTVLQAIGALRQSLQIASSSTGENTEKLTNLHLRGPLVQLGVASDVLSQRANEYKIGIALDIDEPDSLWNFEVNFDENKLGAYTLSTASGNEDFKVDNINLSNQRSKTQNYLTSCYFQFLQANRLTPNTHYDRRDTADRTLGFLGAGGQFTPDFLSENGNTLEVSTKRRCPSTAIGVDASLMERISATPKLYDQVSGWMQHLSPGMRLSAERINQTDLVTLGFSYASTELAQDSDRRRPANVGFGLTYSLPIVTACLSAPKGALLLLENPEAHLHPRGQAAMGTLIAKCAGDGVQILVETHSDHVLNGIRLAVKHQTISSSDVGLRHFTRNIGTGDSYIESPAILPNGELTAWPVGFFDEWERSLEDLLK